VLTPKFGKESDSWVQLGEKSVRPDDQLADMAVAGMLPAVREKLFGMEFDNLGQLSQKLSLMSNQAYGFKKDARFGKQHDVADIYNQFLEKADQMEDSDDD
jgi:hypothetical protein